MRKILFAVFGISFVTYLCFAQPPAAPTGAVPAKGVETKAVETKPVEVKVVTGAVDSVVLADAAKGTKSEIVVVDQNGNKSNFPVRPTTVISDTKANPLTLAKINKGDKVELRYIITPAGTQKVISLKVLAP